MSQEQTSHPNSPRAFHEVQIGGITRKLPLFEVAPGVRIAVLNILGDTELVEAAADALAIRIPSEVQCLVTAEAKSIPLIYALSVRSKLPYIVLRKTYKSYMGQALSAKTHSITTDSEQTLYLDEKDRALLQKKKIAVIDDVISTGSTLKGIEDIINQAQAISIAVMAIFTEGDKEKWKDAITLGHLPVFLDAVSVST